MQDAVPSTLISPTIVDAPSSGISDFSPMFFAMIGIILICMPLVYVVRQRQRIDPRELAFRTMARKMGYTHTQISAIRKHASVMGLGSPIGVVMSHELTAQAFDA